MKKGQVVEGVVNTVGFPNKGIVIGEEDKRIVVKHTLPGQKISCQINKLRKGKAEARLLEVLEKSPIELDVPTCVHFGVCGGCSYQNLSYKEQLALKEGQMMELFAPVLAQDEVAWSTVYEGIKKSPRQFGYRNKMEFSFGDSVKDGPLALGMHKRGSFYDIVDVNNCQIVDNDYRIILSCVKDFFEQKQIPFYHRMKQTGYLRHLLVRKAVKTEEILIDLITSSIGLENGEEEEMLEEFVQLLLSQNFEGKIAGILHTKNSSVADVVKNEGTTVLYGQDYFVEELLGLNFQITPFSFFQTNSLGAEVLYETAREFIGDALYKDKQNFELVNNQETSGSVVYDLYSGTGTIAQMLSPVAKKVIGVEIVEEAVKAAIENAKGNGLTNCEFIAGDVLKALDGIEDKPDFIVLDPPRDGIHPKALNKIIEYGVEKMIYISCKPTSLVRDLEVLQASGYQVKRLCLVDLFPGTVHVESVILLHRKNI